MTYWLRACTTLAQDLSLGQTPTLGVSQPPIAPAPVNLMPLYL